MERGYIKLFRKISDNRIWKSEPFTRGQAWLDLLMLANRKPGAIRKRGILISLGAGDVGYAELTLAERWQWSRGKVRRFIDELVDYEMVERKKDSKKTSVSNYIHITNYEHYQEDGQKTDRRRTEDGQKTVPEQEVKELKEVKNLTTLVSDFKKRNPDAHVFSACLTKWGTENDFILANFIYKMVSAKFQKTKKPNFNTWSNDIRLLRNGGGYTHKDIQELFLWAHENTFWSPNIRSPGSLKKKYDTLEAKRQTDPTGTGESYSDEELETIRLQKEYEDKKNAEKTTTPPD